MTDLSKAELAAKYISQIGYDPFEDDPTITEQKVSDILAEHAKCVLSAAGFALMNQGGGMMLWQRDLEGFIPTRWILVSDSDGESADLSGGLMVGLHDETDCICSATFPDINSALAYAWEVARM